MYNGEHLCTLYWFVFFHVKSGVTCWHHGPLNNGMMSSNASSIWRWVWWHLMKASGTWTAFNICRCIHQLERDINTCWSWLTIILIGYSTKSTCIDRVLRCWFKCWDNKPAFKIQDIWRLKNRWWFSFTLFRKRQQIGW